MIRVQSQHRIVALLLTYGLPGLSLVIQSGIRWSLPSYAFLALTLTVSRIRSFSRSWLQVVPWMIAVVGLCGGVVGLAYGVLVNRQLIGLLVGVSLGALIAAALLGLVGTVISVFNNYRSRHFLEVEYSYSNRNLQIFFLAFIQGMGLAVTTLFGLLLGGPIGLVCAAVWGLVVSNMGWRGLEP